jgi:hypothetical protein
MKYFIFLLLSLFFIGCSNTIKDKPFIWIEKTTCYIQDEKIPTVQDIKSNMKYFHDKKDECIDIFLSKKSLYLLNKKYGLFSKLDNNEWCFSIEEEKEVVKALLNKDIQVKHYCIKNEN